MDSSGIETKATNAVRDIIVESEYLDQFIKDKDKEPSFDGFVYLYSKPGKKKRDFVGRIAVQVKGTQKKISEKAKVFKHKVKIVDLRNYYKEGGVVYFVVQLSPDGKSKRIFYDDLLPIKIHRILETAKEQDTIAIKFKPFPQDTSFLPGLFNSFLEHKKKQAILHDLKEIPRIEDLQESGHLCGITLSTAGSRRYETPLDAILDDDVYVYAALNGTEAHYPVDLLYNTLERVVSREVNVNISVEGHDFYSRFIISETVNETVYRFGESTTFTFPKTSTSGILGKAKINYNQCGSLRQRVIDLDFLISFIKADGIEFNNRFVSFPFDEKPKLAKMEKELEHWKKAILTLDILHIRDDINVKKISAQDSQELSTLIRAFADNKPVDNMRENLPFNFVVSIDDLRIALIHTDLDAPENTSMLQSFFSDNLAIGFTLSDEMEPIKHYAPPVSMLDKSAWETISNINYDDVVLSFDRFYERNGDDHIFSIANNTLLSVLSAYDSTQKEPLLSVAKQLSEWLIEKCSAKTLHSYICTINGLQVVKRCRSLEKNERKQLFDIAEDVNADRRFRVGAYILLDNQEAAEIHFEQLDSDTKECFCEWPICFFWRRQDNLR